MRIARLVCAIRQQEAGAMSLVAFDGNRWEPPQPTPIASSSPPALATFEECLYVLQATVDGELAVTVFDGTRWSPERRLAVDLLQYPPTAAVLGDRLYAIYQLRNPPGELCAWAKPAGSPWETSGLTPSDASHVARSPAAAVLGDAIHVVYTGGEGKGCDGTLRRRILRPPKWLGEQRLGYAGDEPAVPNASAYGQRAYAVYVAGTTPRRLVCWSGGAEDLGRFVPMPTTEVRLGETRAAVVTFGGKLHVLYRSTSGMLAHLTFDGSGWDVPPQPGQPIAREPVATVY